MFYLFVYLFTYLSIYRPPWILVGLYLFIYLSVYLSIYLLSIYLSIYLYLYLYLSIFISTYLSGKDLEMTKQWQDSFTSAYMELGGLGERVLGNKPKIKYDNKNYYINLNCPCLFVRTRPLKLDGLNHF